MDPVRIKIVILICFGVTSPKQSSLSGTYIYPWILMIQVNAQPGASLTVDFYYDDFIYLKELLLILL